MPGIASTRSAIRRLRSYLIVERAMMKLPISRKSTGDAKCWKTSSAGVASLPGGTAGIERSTQSASASSAVTGIGSASVTQ